MNNYLDRIWKQLFNSGSERTRELHRLGDLQRTAAQHRAALTDAMKKVEKDGNMSSHDTLKSLKKRLNDADAAHLAALQKWENKESRQKSY